MLLNVLLLFVILICSIFASCLLIAVYKWVIDNLKRLLSKFKINREKYLKLKNKRAKNQEKISIRIKKYILSLTFSTVKSKSYDLWKKFYEKPKWAFLLLLTFMVVIALCILKLSFIPKTVNSISAAFLAITFTVGGIVFITQQLKEKDLSMKFMATMYLYLFILTFSIIPIIISGTTNKIEGGINPNSVIKSFIIFLALCTFAIITIIRAYKNKIFMFIFTVVIYGCIYLVGTIAFGEYYCYTFPQSGYIDKSTLDLLFNTSTSYDGYAITKAIIKVGLPTFFSYPPDSILCTVSVFQFLVGRFLELIILGLIIGNVASIQKFRENRKNSRSTKESIFKKYTKSKKHIKSASFFKKHYRTHA